MTYPSHELELIDNWSTPDLVTLGYETDIDAPGAEGDFGEGPSYWRELPTTVNATITHYLHGDTWLPIDGPWTLLAPDYSEGGEVQGYAPSEAKLSDIA